MLEISFLYKVYSVSCPRRSPERVNVRVSVIGGDVRHHNIQDLYKQHFTGITFIPKILSQISKTVKIKIVTKSSVVGIH